MKTNYLSAPASALDASVVTIAAWDRRSPAISQKETKGTKVCSGGFAIFFSVFHFDRLYFKLVLMGLLAPSILAQDLDPQRVGSWPGFLRGPASAVAVAGDYAYVAAGALQIIDVSDPARPRRIGALDTSSPGAGDVAVSGLYAYVTHGTGLDVIDVSDPAQPRRVGSYDTLGWTPKVAVAGNHAFVLTGVNLHVFDISDPADPRRVGSLLTLLTSGQGGMTVSGDYVYIADCQSGLQIIDVSDPSNPRRVGEYVINGRCATQVAVVGQHAYVTDHSYVFGTVGSPGLHALDVSDPANPRRVGGINLNEAATGAAVSGNRLYVTIGYPGRLDVIDISDPANLRKVGRFDTSRSARDVAVSGNYAYVPNHEAGLQVIDVGNTANPQGVSLYPTSGTVTDVVISGRYACVADGELGMQVLDVGNPGDPRQVGRFQTKTRVIALAGQGQYVCVAERWWEGQQARGRCHIVDISNPAEPQRVGGFDTSYDIRGLALSGQRAYVTTGGWERGGLEVIDLSIPATPQLLGGIALGPGASGLAISGRYAFVAGGPPAYEGLQVIDVGDPAQLHTVGQLIVSGTEVTVSGNYTYVSGEGFHVIDISNPAHPRKTGELLTGTTTGIAVSGRYAYVGTPDNRHGYPFIPMLVVIDVSDPANPRRVGAHVMGRGPLRVAMSGHRAFVAVGDAGLEVVDVHPGNLANPQRIGAVSSEEGLETRYVAVSGQHAYAAERWGLEPEKHKLAVFDVSDRASPRRVGALGFGQQVMDVAVAGNYAFVIEGWDAGNGWLNVIDISDATAPRRVGAYETTGYVNQVAVSEHHVYVTEGWHVENGGRSRLSVIDVTDPAHPKRVGEFEMAGWAKCLAVSGDRAYLAAGDGFHIIDISDPTQPRRMGGDDTMGGARQVAVLGNLAYLVFNGPWQGHLWILDISDPANLRRLGRYMSPAHSYLNSSGLAISGRYAYLAGVAGLQVIDVSDPANLRRVGGNGAFGASALAMHGGNVYVTSDGGLVILNSYQPMPWLSPFLRLDGTGFQLTLRADSGQAVRVQRSGDLRMWEDWRTVTGTGDPQELSDEISVSAPARFYRAIVP